MAMLYSQNVKFWLWYKPWFPIKNSWRHSLYGVETRVVVIPLSCFFTFYMIPTDCKITIFFNQVCAWFPEIILQKVCACLYACMHACMYIYLSFRTHVSKPFTWSLKAACMQTIKAKQNLYYTNAQV